ncbi:MAG: hypothetical protein LBS26_02405 [Campylobacteraceae bacterium]|jgi:phage protein D|nr:hypothetical protein [Campylobacteraceae bacterium]
MVKKPIFRLILEGKDITDTVAKNLTSLEYEDKTGDEADEISFTLAGLYARKPFGTKIEAYMGYGNELFFCGTFAIQNITKNYMSNTTSIRAASANFASEQKENKSCTWTNTTLYDVAQKIAERNSLKYSIDETAKKSTVSSILQEDIGDLGFLTILASERDFMYSLKNETIMIKPKEAVNEEVLPSVQSSDVKIHKTFKLSDLKELDITEAVHGNYNSVVLTWKDETIAEFKELRVGEGSPSLNLSTNKPKSDAEAIEYANAKLKESQTGKITGSFAIAGQEIRAGWYIEIEDVGRFLVKSASHSLSVSEFTTSCEIEG